MAGHPDKMKNHEYNNPDNNTIIISHTPEQKKTVKDTGKKLNTEKQFPPHVSISDTKNLECRVDSISNVDFLQTVIENERLEALTHPCIEANDLQR